MGPRSENRGYERTPLRQRNSRKSFNGSTVREPWLCSIRNHGATSLPALQWVHGPRTVVMLADPARSIRDSQRFNGSTVREPWLCATHSLSGPPTAGGFNGSTVREPWLCWRRRTGPRATRELQWVHGPRTVVMAVRNIEAALREMLQWVHGPRTVVIVSPTRLPTSRRRRFNGSTVREPWLCQGSSCRCRSCSRRFNGSTVREPWLWPSGLVGYFRHSGLQWVHGPRTVVMDPETGNLCHWTSCFNGSTVREPWLWPRAALFTFTGHVGFNGSTVREPWLWQMAYRHHRAGHQASMGPRSENRGYAGWAASKAGTADASMGPRSENRGYADARLKSNATWHAASMGPRSENRGYVGNVAGHGQPVDGFNGSTVREPWLCTDTSGGCLDEFTASMGPRSENRGYVY